MPPEHPEAPGTAAQRSPASPSRLTAVTAVVLLCAAGPAAGGEIEDLRAENAALRRDLAAARAEIAELRRALGAAAPAVAPAGPAAAAADSGPTAAAPSRVEGGAAPGGAATVGRTETDLVAVRRVPVRIESAPGADPARLTSEWMPAHEGLRVLESVRFALVRSGATLAPLLLLARTAPHGSLADVSAATLEIDGRAFSLTRVDFSTSRRSKRSPRTRTVEREEIATFAVPADAFAQIGGARSATLTAGAVRFPLTEEHIAAAAALAARREADSASR